MTRAVAAPVVRPLTPADRERIEAMTRETDSFRPAEVKVALEVLDAGLGIGRPRDPDYELAGAQLDGELVGWACWGPVPCTEGTFDLYWIVVDPAAQGRGVGSALIEVMEGSLTGRARMIVVETAGRSDYANTRGFYERRGYRVEARIPDYYENGDDLVVYVKRVRGEK